MPTPRFKVWELLYLRGAATQQPQPVSLLSMLHVYMDHQQAVHFYSDLFADPGTAQRLVESIPVRAAEDPSLFLAPCDTKGASPSLLHHQGLSFWPRLS